MTHLQKIYKVFSEVKNLFYYDSYDGQNKLVINKDIASKYVDQFHCNNKVICIQPSVVIETETNNAEYEGILMAINRYDNYTYLTYTEIEYLLYELKRIDMHSLCLQLINTALMLEKDEDEQVETLPGTVVTEKVNEEIVDVKPSVLIQNTKEIPNLE